MTTKTILQAAIPALLTLNLSSHGQNRPSIQVAPGFTVLVDAVVTDSKNRVVTDLTRQEVAVFEDGVAQEIDSFELVQLGSIAPVAGGTPEATPGVRERPNYLVLLIDFRTTDLVNQRLVLEACRKFASENLSPEDRVAVFSLTSGFRMVQDFTADRRTLLTALGQGDVSGRALASTGDSPTAPGERVGDAAGGGVSGAGAASEVQALGSASVGDWMTLSTTQSHIDRREAYSVLGAIQAIARGVEEIQGRKTLALFSQGFVIGSHMEQELEQTVNLANRANLSVYGLDSQGLSTRDAATSGLPTGELAGISAARGDDRIRAVGGESLFDQARQVGSDLRDSALRYLSASTGGIAFRNTNDLHQSLLKVVEDAHTYYLIGYRPKNRDFDGGLRSIRVEVNRKGLQVRARSGYRAVPPGMELLSADEFTLLARLGVGEVDESLKPHFRVDQLGGETSGREVLLTLEIPTSEIRFQAGLEGDLTADISILGLVRNESGRIITRFGSPVTMHATPEEYEVLEKGSVSFNNQLVLPPGMYSFDVVVHDRAAGRAGRVERALMLRSPSGSSLQLSSIILGKEVEASQDTEEGLVFEGTRLLPQAQRRFRQDEKLVFFFKILEPLNSAEVTAHHEYEVSMAVLRSGSETEIPVPSYRLQSSGDSGSVASCKFLNLEGLQPGDYFLVARVQSLASGQSAEGRTPFEVVAVHGEP